MSNSVLHKQPTSTTPLLPKTGNSIDRCYAAGLADCGQKLSREHYISKSLLQYLNRDNDLRVNGFPWIKGEGKVLPPDAFTSKVLCDRHNSVLSPLDVISVRLFEAFNEEAAVFSNQQLLHLFSGHDIERWLLKVLCGMASSKNLNLDIESDLSIPRDWVEILFGEREFSEGQGFYICNTISHLLQGPYGVAFNAIMGRGGITGIGMSICGYELILSMSGFSTRRFDGRQFLYRPMELYTTAKDFEKSIIFSWEGDADLGTIHFKIGKP